jgi:flavin reductase (DIM6/NTAB) family NADH-FMN oxidoreductase RutF
MSIDADLFRSALGRFATGVTIVTVRDREGRDHGMTVSAFSSLSLEPPLVLVSIGNDATMAAAMAAAESFAVNILSANQEALSRRFAGPVDDRFADLPLERGPLGNAILDHVLAWIECKVLARHPAGDHVIVVGEVHSGTALHGRPLLYYRGGYAQIGR